MISLNCFAEQWKTKNKGAGGKGGKGRQNTVHVWLSLLSDNKHGTNKDPNEPDPILAPGNG